MEDLFVDGAWERYPTWMLYDKEMNPHAFRVALYLLRHIHKERNCVWTSTRRIARDLGMHRQTVMKAITGLLDRGIIIRLPELPASRAKRAHKVPSNVYAFTEVAKPVIRQGDDLIQC